MTNRRQRITVAPAAKRRPPSRRLHRLAEAPRIQITSRDKAICCDLAIHHCLTAEQLRRLIFDTGQARQVRGRLVVGTVQSRRVRARLRLLYDADILERIGVVAQPTAGVPPFVYCLTAHGAEIAAAELGHAVAVLSSAHSSLRFLAHHVAVCDFFVTLTQALRATDWTMGQWQHEWQLKVADESGTRRSERVHVTDPDTNQELDLTVLPDAYFTLVKPGATLHFFFELDRGTHRRQRWRERALAFTAYARQGLFRQRFGGQHFQLLIVTAAPSQRVSRADKLLGIIEQTVGVSNLFLVTTAAELNADTLLTPIWRQPGNQQRHAPLGAATGRQQVVHVSASKTASS